MELPTRVNEFLNSELNGKKLKDIKTSFDALSKKYRSNNNSNFISSNDDVLAYAIARMNATINVNYCVAQQLLDSLAMNNIDIKEMSLLDIGSGTMAGNLAFEQVFDLSKIVCVENNEFMLNFAQKQSAFCNRNVEFVQGDMQRVTLSKSDIVLASFCLNELDSQSLFKTLDKLIDATQKYLVIVEAGTPQRFSMMQKIREYLIDKRMFILAPCTTAKKCQICDNDWCHFVCRLNRTREQRYLKDADLSYEDEKYTYLIFSKSELKVFDNRIIARPQISTNVIKQRVCHFGEIKNLSITKQNKHQYKLFKKLSWGDKFSENTLENCCQK